MAEHASPLDSFLEDLTKILREKFQDLRDIENDYAFFILRLVAILLNNKELSLAKPLNASDFELLKSRIIQFLQSLTELQRRIIFLQLYYRRNALDKCKSTDTRLEEIENTCSDLRYWMVHNVPKHGKKDKEQFYKMLLGYIILHSEMGSTSDPHVIKQTEVALGQFFTLDEIRHLYNVPLEDREAEIHKITDTAIGRRLLLNELSPGRTVSAGINDVRKLIAKRLYECASLLGQIRERNIDKLIRYTTLLRPYFLNKSNDVRKVANEMCVIRTGLTLVHQILVFVKEISADITNEDELFDRLSDAYLEQLSLLKQSVSSEEEKGPGSNATAIPSADLCKLTEGWRSMENSLYFLNKRYEIISNIEKISSEALRSVEEVFQSVSAISRFPDEASFFNPPKPKNIAFRQRDDVTRIEMYPDMKADQVTFAGFCPWALVRGYGFILLPNPTLGLLATKRGKFLLSSQQAMEEFVHTPQEFFDEAITVCRRCPELIMLLKSEAIVLNPKLGMSAAEPKVLTSTASETSQEIQTDLHPIESNIVPGYSFNEWDLRKRALELVKLYKCRTKGSQTIQMSLLQGKAVQTSETRNVRIQTNQDKAVEVARSQFFFMGLRGKQAYPPHILELIRETPYGLRCMYPRKPDPCRSVTW